MTRFTTDDRVILAGLFMYCVFAAYGALCELIWWATPGKMLVGLQVRSSKSPAARPEAVQIIVRNAAKILELHFPAFFLVMLIHPMRQRVGDLFAGTMVVQSSQSPGDRNST